MTSKTPAVTGISPREGTPGTKLTIRGENLGTSPGDILHIFIGDVDVGCSAQWFSTSKLTIVTSYGEGILQIIVETKSGGRGICNVDYVQGILTNTGLQDELTYWPPNEQKLHQQSLLHSRQNKNHHGENELINDLTQINEFSESNVNFALSDDELKKYYKGHGSTIMTESDFNPVLYILKYHYNSSYHDLVDNLHKYHQAMNNDRMKEPISIVQANLYSIFQCLERLEMMKKEFDRESSSKSKFSSNPENVLSKALAECKESSHQMYEKVLKRRDYAESARSAYGVMQRFQFLFNLPHSIRQNMEKGEYSLVINDYLRARTLFGRSTIRLFQQVFKDVEEVVKKFKEMLKQQLLSPPLKCESAKSTIRLLKNLEVDYDPTWMCLEHHKNWIILCISKLSLANFSTIQAKLSVANEGPMNSQQQHHQQQHPLVEIMHQLNTILTEPIVELWNLSQYYLDYEQHKSSDYHDNEDITLLMESVCSCYAAKVRDSVAMATTTTSSQQLSGNNQGNWLGFCLQQVKCAIESIHLNDWPGNSSRLLITVLEHVRARTVKGLLNRATQDIAALGFKENWSAEITDGEGAITTLPSQYRTIMINCLTEVTRVLHSRHQSENPVITLSGGNKSNSANNIDFTDTMVDCMTAFVRATHHVMHHNHLPIPSGPDAVNDPLSRNVPPNITRLLLLMANNLYQCLHQINRDILNEMTHLDLPAANEIHPQIIQPYINLYQSLAAQYIHYRLIKSHITKSIITGLNQIKSCALPTQHISSYTHTVITMLALAHSETKLLCPSIMPYTISGLLYQALQIIEQNASALLSNFPKHAISQFLLDLTILEQVIATASQSLENKVQTNSSSSISNKINSDLNVCWSELTSLLNVLKNQCKLPSDDTSQIKKLARVELETIRMLIRGLAN